MPGPRIRAGLAALVAATAGLTAAGTATAQAAAVPSYLKTIGGPGRASVYTSGLDVSSFDNTIVAADTGNDQIVKYNKTTGAEIWRVGHSGADRMGFANPRDVAVNPKNGYIYVADDANSRVEVLSPAGKELKVFTGLGSPIGITFRDNTVLVANAPARRVEVINPTSGALIRTIESNGACQLSHVRDADIDSQGRYWVDDYNNHQIAVFSPTGTCLTNYTTANGIHYKYPYGISVGTDPKTGKEVVFIADSANARIVEIDTHGRYIATIGSKGEPDQPGTLRSLRRVVQDPRTGDVWASDLWGFRLVHFTQTAGGAWKNGSPVQIPSPAEIPPATSKKVFNEPRGMDISADGKTLYVMDTVNQRFEWFDVATGRLLGTCGERGRFSGGDNWPRGLGIDYKTGNVWVADTKDSRVNVIDPTGAASKPTCKVVDTLGSEGTATGQFDYPYAMVIRHDVANTAFFADTENNRVSSWDVDTRKPVDSVSGFRNPRGITVDPADGNIWVADSDNNRIVELADNGSGNGLRVVDTITAGLKDPEGIASDGQHLFVADTGHDRVVELTKSGSVVGTLKAPGGFDAPAAVLATGNAVFVADTADNRVVEFH